MHVQDLKRWHWAVIAVVVGLALSYVWCAVEWNENLPTISQRDFEAGLLIPQNQFGTLLNVTVYPPEQGKYKIEAEQVRPSKVAGQGDARPVAFMADTPYKAGLWRGESDEYPNVRVYLKKLKEANPNVSFKYAWYRETWAIYTLWMGASILLIAGVWPSVVSLMVGAGLGISSEEKGPEYDLSRFKAEQEKKGAHHEPTPQEIAHLRELEDELEKKLAAQRAGLPIPEDEPAVAPAAAKKLDGGPLQAAAIDKPAEEHEYKGEWYPVDRGPKKKS